MTQLLIKEETRPAESPQIQTESGKEHAGELGVGTLLKSLREAKQLSLGEVSSRLKFTTRQLVALENEQWDLLPDGVPLRGFVKNYARFLEADVDALVLMLESQVGVLSPKPIMLAGGPSLTQADLPIQGEGSQRSWGWLLVIVILLLVAGFYALERGWVPDSWLVFDWLKSLKK